MSPEDFGNLVSVNKVREKILKIKERYHPNLIKNLSIDAHNLYLIRDSICNQLLSVTNENEIEYSRIEDFIKQKIKENQEKFKKTSDQTELKLIQLTIEEWEEFL
jgi:hypothetical protein